MQVYWDLTGKACTGICRGPLGATARVVVVEARSYTAPLKKLGISDAVLVHVVILFLFCLLVAKAALERTICCCFPRDCQRLM